MKKPQTYDTYILCTSSYHSMSDITFTDFNCCKGLTLARFHFVIDCLPTTMEINIPSLQTQFLITYSCNSNVLILMETPEHNTHINTK